MDTPTLVKDHGLEHFAIDKLSTRESLVREIQRGVVADLCGETDAPPGRLNGPLGEQIALASGSWLLEDASPEQVAEGICTWLDKYFLQSPRAPEQGQS